MREERSLRVVQPIPFVFDDALPVTSGPSVIEEEGGGRDRNEQKIFSSGGFSRGL